MIQLLMRERILIMKKKLFLIPIMAALLIGCSNGNANKYTKTSTPKFNKLDRIYQNCELQYDEYYRCQIDYYEKEYNGITWDITFEKHWLIYPDLTITRKGYQNYTVYNLLSYDNETHFVLLVELPN